MPIVAEAASTDAVTLGAQDFEWIHQPVGAGFIAPVVSIELRTIGFPERKTKLNEEEVLRLKQQFLLKGLGDFVSGQELLIWVQFLDPDGVHV